MGKMLARGEDVIRYTVEQREQALLALVMAGGRLKEAAATTGVEYETLKSWHNRYRDRYIELQKTHGPELEARAVAGLQAFVVNSELVKAAALQATAESMRLDAEESIAYSRALAAGELADDAKPPVPRVKNTAQALKDVSIAQGISVQKVLELTNRPTQIVEHRSMNEIMAKLRSLGAEIVEGTADELPAPAQLTEGTAE